MQLVATGTKVYKLNKLASYYIHTRLDQTTSMFVKYNVQRQRQHVKSGGAQRS